MSYEQMSIDEFNEKKEQFESYKKKAQAKLRQEKQRVNDSIDCLEVTKEKLKEKENEILNKVKIKQN